MLRRGVPDRSRSDLAAPLSRLAQARGPAAAAIETVGFWIAVLLPLAYVPLLLTGLSSPEDATLLAALVVLHLLALSAGHAHNRN